MELFDLTICVVLLLGSVFVGCLSALMFLILDKRNDGKKQQPRQQ